MSFVQHQAVWNRKEFKPVSYISGLLKRLGIFNAKTQPSFLVMEYLPPFLSLVINILPVHISPGNFCNLTLPMKVERYTHKVQNIEERMSLPGRCLSSNLGIPILFSFLGKLFKPLWYSHLFSLFPETECLSFGHFRR